MQQRSVIISNHGSERGVERTAEFARPVLGVLDVASHVQQGEPDVFGIAVLWEMEPDCDSLVLPICAWSSIEGSDVTRFP